MKILVVDDNAVFRRMLRNWLANYAEELTECEDGESARTVYQELRPDLTLMDVRLPGLNGLEALSQILAADPAAKVVILTSYDDADLRHAAFNLGATAYVPKDELQDLQPIIEAARGA